MSKIQVNTGKGNQTVNTNNVWDRIVALETNGVPKADMEDVKSQMAQKASQTDLNLQKTRIDSLATLSQGSTTGDAELIDGRIGADGVTYTNIGTSIRSQMNNKLNNYNSIPLVFGNTGGLLLTGGTGSFGTWLFTNFIDISNKKFIYFMASGYKGTIAPIAFYDANQVFIKSLTEVDGTTSSILNSTDPKEYNIEGICAIPANAKYCKVSATKNSGTNVDTKSLCKLETLDSAKVIADDCFVNNKKISKAITDLEAKTNSSYNYVLTTYGDSVTALAGWQSSLISKLGISTYTNCGVSGSPIAKTTNVCMNQDARITTIPTNTTLLTFMGGINDWNGSYPIGTVTRDNEDVNTFCGALNVTIKKLITRLPNARIVGMSPTWAASEYKLTNGDTWGTTAWINGQGLTIYDYRDVFKKVCEWWSIPFIDLLSGMGVGYINQDNFMLANEATDPTTPKHHHPNTSGYDRMTKIIYNKLVEIL